MKTNSRLTKSLITIGAVFLFLLALLPKPIPALAATFSVNHNGDQGDANPGNGVCATSGGVCTLRAAIQETNALAGPHTINIPAMTIVLGAELRITDDAGNDSVSIQGAGEGQTILDGNNTTRVFYFTARSGSHSISNLTIRNANNQNTSAAERNGGGIFNEATLTLSHVTITNSRAFQGGGIYNQHAFSGPGGLNVPSLTLTNVTISGNTGTATEFGYGGGGLFNGSVLNGQNITLTGNYAEMQGGGLYHNSYYLSTLNNFVISNNISRDGGGINTDLGDLVLEVGAISNNEARCCRIPSGAATGGGGIYHNVGTLTLNNVTFFGNRATSNGGYGGGIYSGGIIKITDSALLSNQADYGAGITNGFYAPSEPGQVNSLTITNTTFSGNTGVGLTLDSDGGAIFNIDNGHVLIINSTITQNYADVTGGITNMTTNTQVRLFNTIVAENTDYWGAPDCRRVIQSLGHNLIGNPVGAPANGLTCTFQSAAGDLLWADPQLGSLVTLGNTAYHPLLSNSPAIGGGSNTSCPATDQIGYPRPSGLICDIGSIELQLGALQYIFLPLTMSNHSQ